MNTEEIIYVASKTKLWEKYSTKFSFVRYGAEIIHKKATLTSAQILALNITPIALVGAPGVVYCIDVFSVLYSLDYGAIPIRTNTTIETRYTNGSGAKVCVDCAALLAATTDKIVTVKPDDAELVNAANAAAVAFAPSGNPATGNSPVYAMITYRGCMCK